MGPSVKFVSRINGSFSKKNMGQLFSLVKKTKPEGGGPRGVWQKTRLFPFFSRTPSLSDSGDFSESGKSGEYEIVLDAIQWFAGCMLA